MNFHEKLKIKKTSQNTPEKSYGSQGKKQKIEFFKGKLSLSNTISSLLIFLKDFKVLSEPSIHKSFLFDLIINNVRFEIFFVDLCSQGIFKYLVFFTNSTKFFLWFYWGGG